MKSTHTNFIRRLQRQKEDALEFIVDMYLPLIKGITYKILAPLENKGVIEECINDVFLSIWNNSKKFHGDQTDFKKWICAIAKFKAIDYYRKAAKNIELPQNYMDLNGEKSPEDELILVEDRNELIKLMNQLEPMDREIFIMKFFLGLKTEDIAQKFGLTRAAVDNRIYRGKKKLHKTATNLNLGGSVV
ncbi:MULTISPECIES: sigma-70 family RNA polymerase sigma factor [unclassified Bacillus (in: firmicutes)]|uniref:sigma-70 family RNA polymerase sigma factor n=1 Tax=unclassified Bacillus (in: firmicutes) TaxID=185979 RepID=UPI0008E5141F|nr:MULTISPECIES: sigma-70 family RNA polymerase sigma factor [unclassified Bacillus (in: firmicutes)]SFI78806.1 RNA polymerase sigma-70 factor, ECF subfamily [Bacillus sp. 71mf]SFS86087.1 RNA polymerase sigma-70 factor, ECF subfamily [Bacillus sp. 103mf]